MVYQLVLPYLPAYLPKYLPVYVPKHLLAYLPVCTPKYLPIYMPPCIPVYMPAYVPVSEHAYLPSYIPAYLPMIYFISSAFLYFRTVEIADKIIFACFVFTFGSESSDGLIDAVFCCYRGFSAQELSTVLDAV